MTFRRTGSPTFPAPRGWVAMIAAILLACPAIAAEPTASERDARARMTAMAEHLASLPSVTFAFRAGYDVVQPSGQKIEFGETRRITLARPNQLRVEEVAGGGSRDLALFDGKNITVFNADANVFARTPQPGTVDDALIYFVRDLRMRMPLARLLTTQLPSEWPKRVRALDYVEAIEIDGVQTHHVAGRTDAVDFQYWITDGPRPLPLRVVLTYANEPGQPQFWASFTNWNTSPQFGKAAFEFVPPKDAHQIAFAVQAATAAAQQSMPAANEVKP